MAKHRPISIETVTTAWTDIILVCRTCGESGFGERRHDDLAEALKQALRARGQRRQVGIAEVECLGVCPKHAVTVGLASRPDRLLVIPEGELPETVLARLGVLTVHEET
jgi:predicted metal-binding protein